jgi:hypothetical protein
LIAFIGPIGAAHDLAAILDDEPHDRVRARGGIELEAMMRVPERGEIALEGGAGAHVGDLFEVGADFVAELAQVDKKRRPALLGHRGEGKHDRRVRNVAAADVEQPRDGMRIRDEKRVGGELLHVRADARELCLRVFAGKAQIVRHHGAERRLRAIGPDGVDRIVFHRDEAGAGRGAGFAEPFGAVDGMQPRRIAELRAGAQIGFDPGRRRPLDQMFDGKDCAVDLLADLHLIAAVDEQDGEIGKDDG